MLHLYAVTWIILKNYWNRYFHENLATRKFPDIWYITSKDTNHRFIFLHMRTCLYILGCFFIMMASFCTSGQYSQYWPNQIKGMMSSLWNVVFSVYVLSTVHVLVLSIEFGVKLMVMPHQKLEESLHWAEVWDLEDRGPSPELVCLVVDQCEMYDRWRVDALIDGSVIGMKVISTEPNNATHTAMQRRSCKYKWLPCQTILRRWRMLTLA